MVALVGRVSGLRELTERCRRWLGTTNFSSLSHALRRPSSLGFVRALVQQLQPDGEAAQDELVAIDSMAVTLGRTRRHRCKKFNNATVGGGVLWTYRIRTAPGLCPVEVLKVVQGAWHDSKLMRGIELIARGPLYLMDRGFYALELIDQWLNDQVRFIVRVRRRSLVYEVLRTVSARRRIGDKRLELDAVVRLGGSRAKAHPQVRLLIAVLPSGEQLILATDRLDGSAEKVLASYRKRWHIERFHRFLKDALGLAHLYSFHQSGIHFLIYTALLVAMLLVLGRNDGHGETIDLLYRALREVRRTLGLGFPWRRNACVHHRRRGKKKSRNQEQNP